MNDNALMDEVKRGNMDAFDTLVSRYYSSAEQFARSFTRDAALAQDAVQESFTDIYIHRQRYEPTFSFTTYLRAIVRHKCIDLMRKRKHLPLSLSALPRGELQAAADLDTPEARCIQAAFEGRLFTLIDELPQSKRQILILYAFENKSYKEIAAQTSTSVAQVKITLFRVRKALRHMKEEWI